MSIRIPVDAILIELHARIDILYPIVLKARMPFAAPPAFSFQLAVGRHENLLTFHKMHEIDDVMFFHECNDMASTYSVFAFPMPTMTRNRDR